MKSSIATVSISGGLAEKLGTIAERGFDAVEIFENDLLSAPQSAKEIGGLLRELGLACSMFQPFRDYEGLPEEQKMRALERMRRKFAVMDDLGTNLILLCSNCSAQAAGDRNRLIDDLGDIALLAGEHGMRIAYEALAWAPHVNDHREAWGLVRDVDHPRWGLRSTASSRWRATSRHRALVIFAPRKCSSFSSPTRPRCKWTCSTGAAISAVCRDRAIFRWLIMPRLW